MTILIPKDDDNTKLIAISLWLSSKDIPYLAMSVMIEPWDCQCGQGCYDKYLQGLIGIVINGDYGGFSYSDEAIKIVDPTGEYGGFYRSSHDRTDWKLVKAICLLGAKANGQCAHLKVHWIEAKYINYYQIDEYDGCESLEILESDYLVDQIKTIMGEENNDKLLEAIKALKAQQASKEDYSPNPTGYYKLTSHRSFTEEEIRTAKGL